MRVQVRFFASLRELHGQGTQVRLAGEHPTVVEVWRVATGIVELPVNVRAARNQDYVDATSAVADGDEIAFFPPVTGG